MRHILPLAVLFTFSSPSSAATDPQLQCIASKIKAVGTTASAELKWCYSAALGEGWDPVEESHDLIVNYCKDQKRAQLAKALATADAEAAKAGASCRGDPQAILNDMKIVRVWASRLSPGKCGSYKAKSLASLVFALTKAEAQDVVKRDASKLSASIKKSLITFTSRFIAADKKAPCNGEVTTLGESVASSLDSLFLLLGASPNL
jgi:hypothetical protein